MSDTAQNDMQKGMTIGLLVYDDERDCLLLDGRIVGDGALIELRIFDAWVAGQVERDAGGWYVITYDQVGIRLHTGLLARLQEESVPVPAGLVVSQDRVASVLIVDDDPALLEALPRTISLRLPDIRIDKAGTAYDALILLQKQQYDAVVSDIKMPGMDGLELLAKVHEYQPEVPTLLITGHGEHELAIRALRGGAYDYLQKPLERDSFIAALLRAIHTRQLRRQIAEQQRKLETHTRSLERLVQQRTRELVEAQAAKDKVMNLVSHELVGPITHLKEITHLLQQKIKILDEGDETVARSFIDIEYSLQRTEELIQDLQETALIETGTFIPHRQPCDLVNLCHTVLQDIAGNTAATLSWEAPGESIPVDVDCDQIAQILFSLLIPWNTTAMPDVPAQITLQRTQYEALLSIRDLDPHIPLGKSFYVARKMLEQLGGHLEIQNFPGHKRTLFMSLPLQGERNEISDEALSTYPLTCVSAILWYQSNESTRAQKNSLLSEK